MKEHGLEWKYVVVVEESEEKKKWNPRVQCCFCDKIYVGAGSSRIYTSTLDSEQNAFIKPCTKITQAVIAS